MKQFYECWLEEITLAINEEIEYNSTDPTILLNILNSTSVILTKFYIEFKDYINYNHEYEDAISIVEDGVIWIRMVGDFTVGFNSIKNKYYIVYGTKLNYESEKFNNIDDLLSKIRMVYV